ncbi:uncharacterized protein DS421_17g576120 [Arachis hypogaea]|nr:uncharacterized protein DS421_17g576120 [Arachis hypogaea]
MATESSRSCRSRSSAQKRELVCGHGERPIQEECDFFRWADPEAESEDPHVARMKRKVAALKAKVRDIEWKFKVAAVLGISGWVVLFCFWS